jgi:opacity protein-like surface antigen
VVAKMRSSTALLAAAAALLLSLAAAADMSIVSYGERSEEEARRMYAEWKAEHGRNSNAIGGEDELRFAVFRDNLRYIDEHNAAADAGVHSFRLGLNRFADLTNEEYRSTYLGVRTKPERKQKLSSRYQAAVNEDLPESVDWRTKGAVPAVKDQGGCGEHPRLVSLKSSTLELASSTNFVAMLLLLFACC